MIGIIVQTRMNSSRLPGKVLKSISGHPMIWYVLKSLSLCDEKQRLIVATSVEKTDAPIVEYCECHSQAVFRGPLGDVARRFLNVMEAYRLDAFVRICGDSPLIDHRIVDHAIGLFRDNDYDLVTNVMPRTFPKGQSVEVLKADVFRSAYASFSDPEEKEHVTKHFYNHRDRFRIHNFSAQEDWSGCNLCVDTEEDFGRVSGLIQHMEKPHWEYSWRECVKLLPPECHDE